ncbi:protein virilizer homolog isoform X1 [Nicotiana tomentosiformis]|uniref:protein virilizer homolog isoform X1 n=1 Tax=Nicotiana tomentosiformis TaxID=4098 RepID=UPI00051BCB4F|nr:protein virilizer homolog isoform X1 [Nicotiana tomentosiformis]
MGRPEPCVLFAQTFVHPQLDEYVDEVLFAEPVVVTACEFLEQNAASACSSLKLVGATSPPSFALEVFVQCEGETRFRRLCQPFLYSHSSSNVLEVEAIVTNHLVVRGSYRSLSLVVYGNTTEDLGQFNIDVDLDGSLANTISVVEGDLEDLPPALRPNNLSTEQTLSSLKSLSLKNIPQDIPLELRQFLQLILKMLESPKFGLVKNKVLTSLLSVASIYATPCFPSMITMQEQLGLDKLVYNQEVQLAIAEAKKELLEIHDSFIFQAGDQSAEFVADAMLLESENETPAPKQLLDSLSHYFKFGSSTRDVVHRELSKRENMVLCLSLALLVSSARESCYHFVNCGGMEQLGYCFVSSLQNSSALKLLHLGVIEQATRHSVGCEGFLGWWPREDENIPSGTSERYNLLLKVLLHNQRHDVASLATYILHRLRFYEVSSRYECSILSVLGGLSGSGQATSATMDILANAKLQLKNFLKLINSSGPIEDPSLVACASKSLVLGDAGQLSYNSTSHLITQSSCCFSNNDMDQHLLSLLKERGFLPLSIALLSSSALWSDTASTVDLFVDIVSYFQAIVLSLLSTRSGLIFLGRDLEVATTIIHALKGVDNWKKEDSISLRHASVLISKGFFCHPREVALIIEMHLMAINAIDRLTTSSPNSEDLLWVVWQLCGLSRSECGRQALLALVHFPEALSALIAILHSVRESDPVAPNSGASPLNLAIFHATAEIFEVIVSDSTASSLGAWIGHAKELHRVLHSSSPGSSKKDAPARLLDWIDASVVYHRSGAIGLLRYTAILASGGDAHMASTSLLASDGMDVDNVIGDSSCADGSIIENMLGKRITEKDFPGVVLRDSSVVQLTTAFRILAFISDNSAVTAALYDEGAVMVIHAVLINCRLMLERSSNIYDYLVDEGTECNSTSDLLLERNREQTLLDLLIPCLVLLINLLQKLKEAKEQHRNTKLVNALLQLHREVSPKLAACAADVSYPYPSFALGFQAACHLLVSALACWPVYGWTPGLFHFLLDSLHATSVLALGPKEICSLLCLLNDLFAEEGVWLWENGTPTLSVLRTLAVRTLLGPKKEKEINWFLQAGFREKLLTQLNPHLSKIAQIILYCSASTLVVIQDMLRVFIIRIASISGDNDSVLLRPMILWIRDRLSEKFPLSDLDSYKVQQLLSFLSLLLEHPHGKRLFLKEGGLQMLMKVLEKCSAAASLDAKQSAQKGFSPLSWCVPVFKSIRLISECRASPQTPGIVERHIPEDMTAEESCLLLSLLLRFCKVLPAGKELLSCLLGLRLLWSSAKGKDALLSLCLHVQSSNIEDQEFEKQFENDLNRDFNLDWKEHPPLLCCWETLLRTTASKDIPPAYTVQSIGTLSSGALSFCMDGESVNLERVAAIKYLFGFENGNVVMDGLVEGTIESIEELVNLLKASDSSFLPGSDKTLDQIKESARSLMLLLHKPTGTVEADDITSSIIFPSPAGTPCSSKIHTIVDGGTERTEDYDLNEFGVKFLWECPENLRDRLTQTGLTGKRKISSMEGPNTRRARGDGTSAENTIQGAFPRGSIPTIVPSGPTRRDTFRQRKPNTSRPPSMHVDDYVARERSADGSNNPNVIAVPRIGSTSGRPPSIHVDEFMARQRERQNPPGMVVSDSAAAQEKAALPENKTEAEKSSKSRHLKPDPDDDLHGIEIVFDAEESEPDDKLPFPQPDDNLHQPSSVVVEQNSPRSIVEETESEVNETSQFSQLGTPVASNADENTQSEFSSRMSVSRPELPLAREPSVSSDRKFSDQYEDMKNFPPKTSTGFASPAAAVSSGVGASAFTKASPSSVQAAVDSRMPPNFYSRATVQKIGVTPQTVGSQGYFDQKLQPPLPPTPPPVTMSPLLSQSADRISQSSPFVSSMIDVQPHLPPGFHVQAEYFSTGASASMISSPLRDSKFGRTSLSSPGGSVRPLPPLPPTPPPYAISLSNLSSLKNPTSQSQFYNQSVGSNELQQTSLTHSSDVRPGNLSASGPILTSYPPPPLAPPLLFNRPGSVPVSLYGSSSVPYHVEKLPSISQHLPAIHSIPSVTQLQPLQPPQLPRPPQQHLRPLVPASPQSEQSGPLLQSPLHMQMQMQPPQVLHQAQVSPAHVYYQTQQQENVSHSLQQQQIEHSLAQVPQLHGDSVTQQQDSGMSLQEFFKSPEAIQSLLSDRDKLCQLLEQHPKLMQMLQERLGQL